jgi:hypothetical protein
LLPAQHEDYPEELTLLTRKASNASDEAEEDKRDSGFPSPNQRDPNCMTFQEERRPMHVEDAGTEASMDGCDFECFSDGRVSAHEASWHGKKRKTRQATKATVTKKNKAIDKSKNKKALA